MTGRKFVEPVAEFLNVIGGILAGEYRESWRAAADIKAMQPLHWVDCEGFNMLRILALGRAIDFNGGPELGDFFFVTVYTYAEAPYVTGSIPPMPLHVNKFTFSSQNISADQVPAIQNFDQVVSETVDIAGAKSLGIRVDISTLLSQPDFQLKAFLL